MKRLMMINVQKKGSRSEPMRSNRSKRSNRLMLFMFEKVEITR